MANSRRSKADFRSYFYFLETAHYSGVSSWDVQRLPQRWTYLYSPTWGWLYIGSKNHTLLRCCSLSPRPAPFHTSNRIRYTTPHHNTLTTQATTSGVPSAMPTGFLLHCQIPKHAKQAVVKSYTPMVSKAAKASIPAAIAVESMR